MVIMLGELREQTMLARHNLAMARQNGPDHDVDIHQARLDDLLDIAHRHGIDVAAWMDQDTDSTSDRGATEPATSEDSTTIAPGSSITPEPCERSTAGILGGLASLSPGDHQAPAGPPRHGVAERAIAIHTAECWQHHERNDRHAPDRR
ncbi:hypothetical protein ACQEVB_38840 [Pseudonocardia sp. CA-107938]|uniref:hypothetical protein n=1 Tax=Pseudonocardia sp. CA-107938 TaxID=3240021 RepID=UPI003D8FC6CE